MMDLNKGDIIHILREPETPTAKEELQLSILSKNARIYLSKRGCMACEKPLNQKGCGSFYEACSEQTRIERRKNCLKKYKPRTFSGLNR